MLYDAFHRWDALRTGDWPTITLETVPHRMMQQLFEAEDPVSQRGTPCAALPRDRRHRTQKDCAASQARSRHRCRGGGRSKCPDARDRRALRWCRLRPTATGARLTTSAFRTSYHQMPGITAPRSATTSIAASASASHSSAKHQARTTELSITIAINSDARHESSQSISRSRLYEGARGAAESAPPPAGPALGVPPQERASPRGVRGGLLSRIHRAQHDRAIEVDGSSLQTRPQCPSQSPSFGQTSP